MQVSRAEGLSVSNRCLTLESHRSCSVVFRRNSWWRAIVEGIDENGAMHRARKVHPLLTRRGYANVVVDCVREHYSSGKLRSIIDKRKATRRGISCFCEMSGREREIQQPES